MDRVEQITKLIIPALNEGKTVISDRWVYSTEAYQFSGKELLKKYEIPDDLHKWLIASIGCKKPDLTLYFTTKVGHRKNDENDKYDTAGNDFFSKVKKAYEKMANKYNWLRVQVGNSAEETAENILKGFM
jgi:dTMP kinase